MERGMIVCLLGKAGAGKTTIANAMEEIVPDSFVIDGDDLRAETSNIDIGLSGREKNMHLGYSRARWLSDLGFTVFLAMQAPIKEIREEYLKDEDIQVVIINSGPNPKDDKGYNKNFEADYSDTDIEYEFTEFSPEDFYNKVFKKVLVIARFQGMHRGHRLVMEVAKRLSPDVTIALRADDGDMLDLDSNINLLQDMGYNVIKSPDIDEDDKIWEEFVSEYNTVVQGNPVVIKKFQKAIDDNKVKLHFVPRVGHISATKIREAIKEGNDEFARKYVADKKVLDFLKSEIT
jgi:energy-coupling factor transporter ATP-binding protein EcfA2